MKICDSQGILCVSPPDLSPGDEVAVMADVKGKCLKGSKTFAGEMLHVGDGVLKVSREALVKTDVGGVGVEMTNKIFPCPSLNESEFAGTFILQNLPSIMAVDLLGLLKSNF